MTDFADIQDLMAKARAGHRDAADQLFARAADRVLLYVRMRLGVALRARVDAMDVLQETFLHAQRAWERFVLPEGADAEIGRAHV